MFKDLLNKGVSVYIDNPKEPMFKNFKLIESKNGFLTLISPDDFSPIYVNMYKILYIERYQEKING